MLDELDRAWGDEAPRRPRRPPQSRQQQRRRKKRRGRKGRSPGSTIFLIILVILLGAGVYWGVGFVQESQKLREYFAADYAPSDMGDEVQFRVRQGDGGTVIGIRLLEVGVVKSRTAFVQVCQRREDECTAIQPGTYLVQEGSPAETVFDILIDPANKIIEQITVREGLTVIQTLNLLAQETGLPLADFQAAAADPAGLGITAEWYARPNGRPAATTSIEGFLFPDTYFYDPAASAKEILQQMVDQFFVVAQRVGIQQRAAAMNISAYEVLITASIAQSEGLAPDFAKVARVVYNRAFRANMPLGMDSTENYWLELNGQPMKPSGQLTQEELNDPNNPYNTHGRNGLPIGPISNPGEAALVAAANPAEGNWLYFVTIDTSGTTAFANSYAQHCANINTAIANGVDLERC